MGCMVKQYGRGTARAEDAQRTPTQSHISPSILVYEDSTVDVSTLRFRVIVLPPFCGMNTIWGLEIFSKFRAPSVLEDWSSWLGLGVQALELGVWSLGFYYYFEVPRHSASAFLHDEH